MPFRLVCQNIFGKLYKYLFSRWKNCDSWNSLYKNFGKILDDCDSFNPRHIGDRLVWVVR